MSNLPSERLPVCAILDPANYTTSTGTGSSGDMYTDAVDMTKYDEVMFVVNVGAFGTSAALAISIVEASTSYASLSAALATAKNATSLTEAGSDGNKQVVVNLKASEMTYKWAWCKMLLTVGSCYISAVGLGVKPRYSDAVITTSWGDLASVDEIVS